MVTVKTLFVYDTTGAIVHSSVFREGMNAPVGLPSIVIDIPEGVVVKSIDPVSQKPVYEKSTPVASEIDKLSAKLDYVAMMMDVDLSRLCSTYVNPHDRVREYYITGLWDLKALRDAQVKGWITQKEYGEIIIEKENLGVDTEHEIPSVEV